ncbi:hypothetical protein OAM32_03160 [Alphaproteobacteria bacterium]|nr:hypothetical protein [Alphaproteobacteria bacterium]
MLGRPIIHFLIDPDNPHLRTVYAAICNFTQQSIYFAGKPVTSLFEIDIKRKAT